MRSRDWEFAGAGSSSESLAAASLPWNLPGEFGDETATSCCNVGTWRPINVPPSTMQLSPTLVEERTPSQLTQDVAAA